MGGDKEPEREGRRAKGKEGESQERKNSRDKLAVADLNFI